MKFAKSFLPVLAALAVAGYLPRGRAAEVSYNRDIRPILSDNCFYCHGPDKNHRKGKMRLDVREEALTKEAFVPGKPAQSELIKRIHSQDPDEQMPPPESNKKLTATQKELLKRWIAEGARYEGHWAYLPPRKPAVASGANGIDALVAAHLKAKGWSAAREADRRTLIRRLYFDVVGLPPKPEAVAAFEHAADPEAYRRVVETLLASPQYGERMAMWWLDAVRFADTIGYHSDNPRNIWPYRDYVIGSFNANKPFDVFTREQVAGDLLPHSGQEQKVGSAFNRLLLTTEEGGAQAKDYEARMLTDRVRAVGSVWLGQTIGCAQCHDHKFDPITSRDFYSLGAFFADIEEPIIGRREDGMLVPDATQKVELEKLSAQAERLERAYGEPHSELAPAAARWEAERRAALAQDQRWSALGTAKAESAGGAKLVVKEDKSILAEGNKPDKDTYTITVTNAPARLAGLRLEALPDGSLPAQGPGRAANGNFVLTEVVASVRHGDGSPTTLRFATARASFEQTEAADKNPYKAWTALAAIDQDVQGESPGWAVLPEVGKVQQLVLEFSEPWSWTAGDSLQIELRQNHGHGNHTLGHFRLSAAEAAEVARAPIVVPPAPALAKILGTPEAERTQEQKDKLWDEFKAVAPELAPLRRELAEARKARTEFEGTVARCLVSVSAAKPRTVRILPRGNFLVETGDLVKPALPGYLVPARTEPRDLNRLDLAEWLVSRQNPLTARVIMNRLWKQFFGIGLSKVLDDFGAQGEVPANPELLDWLAGEFMDSGWDVKHMVRLILQSRTYRLSSTPSKEMKNLEPFNRELARQGRWRLDAELVRDNALSIAGLLVTKVGGPSVKPYQPDGYWENLNFPTRTWEASQGENQYRRGLYTWWQRSYVHPSLLAFDAPTREECAAERNRSNIPQQALVLLNDPSYVEAARVFAARIQREGGATFPLRLAWAWRQALGRTPRADEVATAQALFEKHLAEYRQNKTSAEELRAIGQAPAPGDLDASELAAWTSVARVLLNLHETITRS